MHTHRVCGNRLPGCHALPPRIRDGRHIPLSGPPFCGPPFPSRFLLLRAHLRRAHLLGLGVHGRPAALLPRREHVCPERTSRGSRRTPQPVLEAIYGLARKPWYHRDKQEAHKRPAKIPTPSRGSRAVVPHKDDHERLDPNPRGPFFLSPQPEGEERCC